MALWPRLMHRGDGVFRQQDEAGQDSAPDKEDEKLLGERAERLRVIRLGVERANQHDHCGQDQEESEVNG
jgi:hypothetical protein